MNAKDKMTAATQSLLVTAVFFMSYNLAIAADVNIPNQFSAGNPAVAADVNANFSAVETAVDDNNARLNALETAAATASFNEFKPVDGFSGCGLSTDLGFSTITINQFICQGACPSRSCAVAAYVQFPPGAQLSGISCQVFDNALGSAVAYLQRSDTGAILFSTAASGNSASVQTLATSGSPQTIDPNHVYFFRIKYSGGNNTSVRAYRCTAQY